MLALVLMEMHGISQATTACWCATRCTRCLHRLHLTPASMQGRRADGLVLAQPLHITCSKKQAMRLCTAIRAAACCSLLVALLAAAQQPPAAAMACVLAAAEAAAVCVHLTSKASSTASPIISLVISMRSFCRSNSRMICCSCGKLSRRFMTRMACVAARQVGQGWRGAKSYLFIITSAQLRSQCDVWLALKASLQTVQHAICVD
jgi:hypothetical protein